MLSTECTVYVVISTKCKVQLVNSTDCPVYMMTGVSKPIQVLGQDGEGERQTVGLRRLDHVLLHTYTTLDCTALYLQSDTVLYCTALSCTQLNCTEGVNMVFF